MGSGDLCQICSPDRLGVQIFSSGAAAQVPQSPLWEGQLKVEYPSPASPPHLFLPSLRSSASSEEPREIPSKEASLPGLQAMATPLTILKQSPARSAPSQPDAG